MEWVPLSDYENGMNFADKPRAFTDEELVYITAHMPYPPSADISAAEVARQRIVEWITITLKELAMCPSAIPWLIADIIYQHNKSLISPGTPIGFTASETVGAAITQMTLNTFHTSGSATSVSFGINAMRDRIFARKVPKNESSTIYYTNKNITYEEVLESRRYIVGSVVKDFVSDYDIDSPGVLTRYWWHDAAPLLLNKTIPNSSNVLRLYLNTVEMFKQKVTIAELAAVLEREMPPSSITIYGPIGDGIIDVYPQNTLLDAKIKERIPVDLAELTYLETIVVPELVNIRVKGIAGIRHLVPVISPVWRMVLLERKLTENDLTNPALQNALGKYLGRAWFLFYNKNIMKMTGLVPENLAALCKYAGINIIAGAADRLIIEMPNDNFRAFNGDSVQIFDGIKYRKIDELVEANGIRFREVNKTNYKRTRTGWTEKLDEKVTIDLPVEAVFKRARKTYKVVDETRLRQFNGALYEEIVEKAGITEILPNEYVASKVKESKALHSKEIERLAKINRDAAEHLPEAQKKILHRKPIIVPRTDIMKAAEFVIAETNGANLKELLALPGIDKKRTTCNNMHTICDTLGIEAARTFLIQDMHNIIANTGSYVNPANIIVIAEFITNRGKPYGATYTGVARQQGGHLSLATIERAGKVFTQNALHGRKEDIRNVSASVAVGARMAIGTGFFDIAQDIVENGVPRTVINDDLFTALSKDDASRALSQQQQMAVATNITPADVDQAIDALNALKLGGATFDYTGEDDTNLIGLFTQGEIIPEMDAPVVQQDTTRKILRRVAQPIVPANLIDTLAQIKEGIPLPEKDARVEIRPLGAGVAIEQARPVPIVSTGLIPGLHVNIPTERVGAVPQGLEALLNQYFAVAGPEAQEPQEEQQVVDLPTEEIPDLPDIEGLDLAAGAMEMRREQVRNLDLINMDALNKELAE